MVSIRAANSIEFYSSSAYFSKSEFKFEFSNLIIYWFEFDKNKIFRVQVRAIDSRLYLSN